MSRYMSEARGDSKEQLWQPFISAGGEPSDILYEENGCRDFAMDAPAISEQKNGGLSERDLSFLIKFAEILL